MCDWVFRRSEKSDAYVVGSVEEGILSRDLGWDEVSG